jgi:hypothetical protein
MIANLSFNCRFNKADCPAHVGPAPLHNSLIKPEDGEVGNGVMSRTAWVEACVVKVKRESLLLGAILAI